MSPSVIATCEHCGQPDHELQRARNEVARLESQVAVEQMFRRAAEDDAARFRAEIARMNSEVPTRSDNARLRADLNRVQSVLKASTEAQARLTGEVAVLRTQLTRALDALYMAWTIIANAHGGDWSKAEPAWRNSAVLWRDEVFHPLLAAHDQEAGDG